MKLGLIPSLVAGTTLTVAGGAAALVYLGSDNDGEATSEAAPPPDRWAISPDRVNPEVRDGLLARGVPKERADFFSATTVDSVEVSPLSVRYRELYANGSTRIVTITYVPEKRYDLSPAEVAVGRQSGGGAYRPEFTSEGDPGNARTRLQFFVPYESMRKATLDRVRPPGRSASPIMGSGRPAMLQQSGGVGAEVIIEGVSQEISIQSGGQAAEALSSLGQAGNSGLAQGVGTAAGTVFTAFDVAVDVAGAWDLSLEHRAQMAEIARLRRCAQSPTSNGVPVPQSERDRTDRYLRGLESDIISMNNARFLNQVADAPLNLLGTQAVANPAGAAIAAAVSVLVKPAGVWSEATLKQAIENRLEAARQAVPFCDDSCLAREPAPQQAAPAPAPEQNFTPGAIPPPAPPRAPTCDPTAASITYRYVDRNFPSDGGGRNHLVTFSAIAPLSNIVDVGPLKYRLPNYSGKGTGRYRETEDHSEGRCSHNIAINGDATMEVRVQTVEFDFNARTGEQRVTRTLGEVNVLVKTMNATRSDNTPSDCTTYSAVGDGPVYEIGCTFSNVDLQDGGIYKSTDDDTDYIDDDEERNIDCTLDLGPLKFELPPLAQGACTASAQECARVRP